ncbi:hypothetical protein IQ26_01199 [Mesorhizobium tianshanense]|uniref:Uncharacterized protein n=1 Tax=Mesorhizobium tianshanense TaxID=39844 RepID=A0A562P8R5_9HYPH|nr:hypothetical protein IQ26_01199 [Mesorhizobium tianshanense]
MLRHILGTIGSMAVSEVVNAGPNITILRRTTGVVRVQGAAMPKERWGASRCNIEIRQPEGLPEQGFRGPE